ncbi:MAG: 2-keto-3-deoxy-D-arabino-heptulosonate-7-phosphate synthase I beta, partial [uncultured Gemmatimonadetes bacterium]
DHRHPPQRHRRRAGQHPRARRNPRHAHAPVARRAAHHHRLHRRRGAAARGRAAQHRRRGIGAPRAQAVQAGLARVLRRALHRARGQRGRGGRARAGHHRRAVLGGRARHAARDGAVRGGFGSGDAARRRLQAALVAVRLPGAGRGGPEDAGRGARRDGAAHRHRGDGHAAGGAGGGIRGRAADRRAKHAELFPTFRGGPGAAPGAAQARDERHHQGVPDGRRVRDGAGQPRRHPVRARHPHLRNGHAQHAGHRGHPRAQGRDAPAGDGGPQPCRRPGGPCGAALLRRHRCRRRRAGGGGAPLSRAGPVRRRPVADAAELREADAADPPLRRGRGPHRGRPARRPARGGGM